MNNNFEKKFLSSFDKNHASNIFFKKPEKYREIEIFSKNSENLISLGSNYSYSPLGFDQSSLILDIRKFDRILDFNETKKEITVEAGLKIYNLLKFTLQYNLWLPQIPGYPFITLGGIVATNSHGKSCGTHGTIRNSIKKITLFHKTHGWLNLSEDENREIFDLTIGGLGLTGTIVSITFKLSKIESNSFVTDCQEVKSTKECLELLTKNKENNTFIYSWNRAENFKNFGSGFVYKNHIDTNFNSKFNFKNLSEKKITNFIPFSLWNRISLKCANSIYFFLQRKRRKKINENFVEVMFPFLGKESYFKFFGSRGFIESQILVSQEKALDFVEEIRKKYKENSPLITLFSLKNMSGTQKFLRFEDNKVCITFDFVNNSNSRNFLSFIDKMCIKYNALPSIIKDSRLTKELIDKCYLEADEFRDKLRNYDRNRFYQSKISKRLDL